MSPAERVELLDQYFVASTKVSVVQADALANGDFNFAQRRA
jgi:hypothetical protein